VRIVLEQFFIQRLSRMSHNQCFSIASKEVRIETLTIFLFQLCLKHSRVILFTVTLCHLVSVLGHSTEMSHSVWVCGSQLASST